MYWLVSLPWLDGVNEDRTWQLLQNKVSFESNLAENYKFKLPELRVGTLDSLMVLSDDLVKTNALVEAVVNKLRRQLFDLQTSGPSSDKDDVTVDGTAPDDYVKAFKWDQAKYPPRRPLQETVQTITETVQKLEDDLKETVQTITETMQKLEDDLKVRVSEYNSVKGQLGQLNRKQGGSLAVRDIAGLVKESDVTNTEYLTTQFVVVSKFSKQEFLSEYEGLTEYVVPRSANFIQEDNEYALFSFILFRKIVDSFKSEARQRGWQVRDFEYNAEKQASQRDSAEQMKQDAEKKRGSLEQWSASAYGEAFSAWIHICAVRLFCESVLRYGVPPKFLAALVKPNQKQMQKLRKLLAAMFSSGGQQEFFNGDTSGAAGMASSESEMYPYVSFTISIEN